MKNEQPESTLQSLAKGFFWVLGALVGSMVVTRLFYRVWDPKPPDAPPEWHREPSTVRWAPVPPAPPTRVFDEFGSEIDALAENDLLSNFLPKTGAPRREPEPEVKLEDIMAPRAVDEAAGVGETPPAVTIVDVTSPVARGSEAKLSARAVPGMTYTASFTRPDGVVRDLHSHIASPEGSVVWEWTVEAESEAGTGSILVTASGDPEASAAATIEIS